MYYYRTTSEIGTERRPNRATISVSRETEKAVLFSVEQSRFPGEPDQVWIPKSTLLAYGPVAVVFAAAWASEKLSGYGTREQIGFRHPDGVDMATVQAFVARRIAETGTAPSQSEIDRLAAPRATDKRTIMTRAWAIARQGASRFGGPAREYFSSALRQAWAETR